MMAAAPVKTYGRTWLFDWVLFTTVSYTYMRQRHGTAVETVEY